MQNAFYRRAARRAGLSRADENAAESVLGERHAFTRAIVNQHTLALQSVVSVLAVVAAVVAEMVHLPHATLGLVVASGSCIAFVVAWSVARQTVGDRARDLIARGEDRLVLPVVARERRRLASRKVRERLAGALEAFHRDALHWSELRPQYRPPREVVQLRHTTKEVEAVTAALRGDRVRVQGVALASQLITDGQESPLYAGAIGPLREELNRIRYLLESGDEALGRETERKAA